MSIRQTLQLCCKIAVIVLCAAFALDGRHPPAQAQEIPKTLYVQPLVTSEDVGQDHDIAALNKHLESTDANVERQWSTLQSNTNEISGLRGEERIFAAVIGLLSGGGLLLNFSRRRTV